MLILSQSYGYLDKGERMKEYIPRHLQNHCRVVNLYNDNNGGLEVIVQLFQQDTEEFKLLKSKNTVSPGYLKYLQYMKNLEKQYVSYLDKGYSFCSRSKTNG